MKRLLQSVALALTLFLATQPMLADTPCPQQRCGGDHSTAECCANPGSMVMPASSTVTMRTELPPMEVAVLATADCSYGSCCRASARTAPQLATPPKSRLAGGLVPLTPSAQFSAVDAAIWAAGPPLEAAAPATARYILFHVFRI